MRSVLIGNNALILTLNACKLQSESYASVWITITGLDMNANMDMSRRPLIVPHVIAVKFHVLMSGHSNSMS